MLVCQLGQCVGRVGAAAVREAAEFVQVAPFTRELDELINSISVTVCGARPQVHQFLISRALCLPRVAGNWCRGY